MAKYIRKPTVIEAITFEEFVEYGKKNATSIVNGTPWSFRYKDLPVTHHKDDCYLLTLSHSVHEVTPDDVIVTDINGTGVMKKDFFDTLYDEVVDNG
jgi:hypothetical protein